MWVEKLLRGIEKFQGDGGWKYSGEGGGGGLRNFQGGCKIFRGC